MITLADSKPPNYHIMRTPAIFGCFILLLCSCGILNAQQIKISGTLKDSVSRAALPYSNVIVVNSSDSVIAGSMTDGKGNFRIKTKPGKNLKLKARSLGYKTKTKAIEAANGNFDAGIIYLPPDTAVLGEVSIASQNEVISKFDRDVYRVSEVKKAAAKDIYDLLRTLPGVIVDEDNNIRYKGGSPEVLVDDMPAKYIYPDLAMIPVDNVDKIELIDAAMRTGGDGTGGIINIKLKHATSDGISGAGRIRGGVTAKGDRTTSNGYLNLNYKKGKVLFFNNIWYYDHVYLIKSRSKGSQEYDGDVYSINKHNMSKYNYSYLMDYAGLQINFSPKSKLMISGGLSRRQYSGTNDFVKTTRNDGQIYQQYETQSDNFSESYSPRFSAYYRKSFDSTLRELTAYISHSFPDFNITNESNTYYNWIVRENQHENTTDHYYAYEKQKESNTFFSIYYNHPISKNTRWNVRYWAGYANIAEDKRVQELNGTVLLPLNESHSGYTHRQNLSLRFGSKLGKWKLDAGIKQQYEVFNIDVEHFTEALKDTLIKIENNYFPFEPSVNIYYELDSLQDLKLTVSRSVRTPYYMNLDGFVSRRSPVSWSAGNPNLESSEYVNAYLGYTFNKPLWNATAELFYNMTNNATAYLSYPVTEIIYMSMPDNIAFKSRLGVDLSAFFSISGKYSFSFSSSIYHSYMDASGINDNLKYTAARVENVVKRDYGFNAKLNTNIKFAKNTTALIYMQYISPEVDLEGYDYGHINSFVTITQSFFERKLQLSFTAGNLLDDLLQSGSYTNYMGREETTENYYSTHFSRTFSLSIRYRFRQGDRNTGRIGQNGQE